MSHDSGMQTINSIRPQGLNSEYTKSNAKMEGQNQKERANDKPAIVVNEASSYKENDNSFNLKNNKSELNNKQENNNKGNESAREDKSEHKENSTKQHKTRVRFKLEEEDERTTNRRFVQMYELDDLEIQWSWC